MKKSHRVWNEHNPNDKIGSGRYEDVIHHKDENPKNNHISNLRKMSFENHIKLHNTGNSHSAGCKRSKELRKRISKLLTGRALSEEHKKRVSESRIGMKFSEEHKKKMSENMKRIWAERRKSA